MLFCALDLESPIKRDFFKKTGLPSKSNTLRVSSVVFYMYIFIVFCMISK